MAKEITREVASKVLEVVDAGLSFGMGKAEPGKMCVEAAVCFALGEPHTDRPSCVGDAVRRYKIGLNDSNKWKSSADRAKGLRRLAIAQLGSNEIDQKVFVENLVIGLIKGLLPDILRRRKLDELAVRVEAIVTIQEARNVAKEAKKVLDDAYATSAAAYAYAYATSAAAAYDAAAAAAYAYAYAASAAAYDAAAAAAYAYAYAASAAAAQTILEQAAEIGVQVLIEMDCKGTQFLSLTE